jgi:AraC family transcriptional regulator
MSLANNKVTKLWQSFMPERHRIQDRLTDDLISVAVYPSAHFTNFKPTNEFDKWAAVEVSDFDQVPDDMESFVLSEGLYAVFDYKGLSSDQSIYHYIFSTWLPNSAYDLDHRPHFEVLGAKYKNNDPDSEEEIWIPIKKR